MQNFKNKLYLEMTIPFLLMSPFRPNVPLRGYDKHGRKVFVIRSSYVDHEKVQMSESIRVGLMTNELLMGVVNDAQV